MYQYIRVYFLGYLKKKIVDIRRIIKKLFVVIFIFAGFLTAIIFNFSESFLELIYNKAEITNNAIIMKILSFITLISALNMLFNYLYLNSIKGYKVRMKIFLVTGIFGIILAFVLTYNFKIYGISISFLGTEIILLLFGLYYFKRGEKIL